MTDLNVLLNFSEDPVDNFAHHYVYTGTAGILKNVGFRKSHNWCMDTMADIQNRFIKKLLTMAKTAAENGNGERVGVPDLFEAFRNWKAYEYDLVQYMVTVRPFEHSEAPDFPVQLPENFDDVSENCLLSVVPQRKKYEITHRMENNSLLHSYYKNLNPSDDDASDNDEVESISSSSSSTISFVDELDKAMTLLELRQLEEQEKKRSALDFAGSTMKNLGFSMLSLKKTTPPLSPPTPKTPTPPSSPPRQKKRKSKQSSSKENAEPAPKKRKNKKCKAVPWTVPEQIPSPSLPKITLRRKDGGKYAIV